MPIDYSKFDKIGEDPPLPEMPEAQKQAMRNQMMQRCLETGQCVGSHGGCFSCGLLVPNLLCCGGCHYARYCTRTCQRRHWPEHREDCLRRRNHKVDATGKFVDMRTSTVDVDTNFRKLSVLPPRAASVVGSCYGCGIMLKKTLADPANSKGEDLLGVFWVRRPSGLAPTRKLSDVKLLEPQGLVGVCLNCARAFSDDESKHAARCRRWLDLGEYLSEETLLRRRQRSRIRLHSNPKLDNLGCAAGLLRDNGKSVPFAEPRLEQWAFPALGIKQGWRQGDDARHYAFARLYSCDPRFRDDSDYVAFLAHRTACAGDAEFRKFVTEQLPPPLPALALEAAPLHSATFWSFEDGSNEDVD